MRRAATLAGVAIGLLALVAHAADVDPRGWTRGGQPAASTEAVLRGPEQTVELDLPAVLKRQVRGPTVLFYFSPTCPHCRHVAREVQALHERLNGARLVAVASGSARPDDLAEFQRTFGTTFPVVHDVDRQVSSAFGLRSTPVAVLVEPRGKGRIELTGAWYPYVPGFDALIEGRVRGDPFVRLADGGGQRYLGTNACGSCHSQEYNSWRLTHHSVAWRTLTKRNEHTNGACTSCHVTGAGAPGGWNGDLDSMLVDVGCEACHGPGGPHDGVPTEPKGTCATCHDAEHSIAFSYEKGLPLVDHYRATHMTEEAYQARLQALYEGEAPRELLRFQEGKNVGSAACRSCHPTQHDWWATNGHATAMQSLRKEGSGDPDCVRCHASAVRSGPVPAAIASYRIFEGVGCESCHGPGEAHIAAEGAPGTIEGLGDDCPVCVIEALCTSCHTQKWSPDWDLDKALEQIDH